MSGLKLETITLRTPNQQIIANYEDIQANRELIDLHYETDRVIAELGVRIIGSVASYEEIENTIPEQFGDGYAVGEPGDYVFYIWTRRSPTTPLEDGEWLLLGPLAIAGPTGPSPIMGNDGTYITATDPKTGEVTYVIPLAEIKGERGNTWRVGYAPQVTGNEKIGDMALDTTNGNVYSFMANQWVFAMNIKGPQGIRGVQGLRGPQGIQGPVGPKGDTGDTGGLVNIAGILDNIDQLLPPASLNNTTIAYLVGTTDPRNLYIQVGTDPATAQWQNIGPINTATLVFVNDKAQNIWDADTKVDKLPLNASLARVYVENTSGQTIGYAIDNGSCTQYRLAEYKPINDGVNAPGGTGSLLAPDPQNPYQVANKNYVDTKAVLKPAAPNHPSVIVQLADGSIIQVQYGRSTPVAWTIPTYQESGQLIAGTPTSDIHAVNKSYADSHYIAKSTSTYSVYATDNQGNLNMIKWNSGASADSIALRGSGGTLEVGTPTSDGHAATKKYVDNTEKYNKVELSFGIGTVVDTSTLTTSKVYKLDIFTNRNTELVKTNDTKVTIEEPVEIIGTLRYNITNWLFQGYAVKSDNTVFTFSESNISQVEINDLTGLTPYYKLVEIA